MPQDTSVFFVEDDPFFSELVKEELSTIPGIHLRHFLDAASFFDALFQFPAIVIADYNLPETNGIEILKEIKKSSPETSSIMISGQQDLQIVVEAYNNGAKRYIIKGDNAYVELKQCIQELRKEILLKKELESLKQQLIKEHSYANLVGSSDTMQKVFVLMKKVEKLQMPVLITGESGTGKELVAQALHYNSGRKKNAFVALNVAAIPSDLIESELFGHDKGAFTGASGKKIGKFEQANKGTLFLDEIGELEIGLQAKLLRAIQERKISRLGSNKVIDLDIQILTATNKDLWKESQAGRFREDLYFRLQGFPIQLPPLRERDNDILILAKHFIDQFCSLQKIPVKAISPDAAKKMLTYEWPGNVRELKTMVERSVLIADGETIAPDDLVFL